jgi:transcriptional regulator with XRE-family HTH domain
MSPDREVWKVEATAFGQRVALRMEALGLSTQQVVNREAGLNPAVVYRILHGNHNPKLSSMVILARALGTELHVLLGSADTQEHFELVSQDIAELIRLLRRVPEPIREAVVAGLVAFERALPRQVQVSLLPPAPADG